MSTVIYAGSSVPELAQKIGQALNVPLGQAELAIFPNQELRVHLLEDAADTVVIIQSLAHPVDRGLMQYCLIADAARHMGAKNIIGVIPYLGYSKQDKVFRPGEPLSSQVVANIIGTTTTQSIVTVDVHNPAIADYFPIPVTSISARPLFEDYLKNVDKDNTVVVAPDQGAIERSQKMAKSLKLSVACCKKNRDRDTGSITITGIDKPVANQAVLIFDDMIATGNTLVETARFLKAQGAGHITVCATHHLYVPEAQAQLDGSAVDELIVTDTVHKPPEIISDKLTVLSSATLLAKTLAPMVK